MGRERKLSMSLLVVALVSAACFVVALLLESRVLRSILYNLPQLLLIVALLLVCLLYENKVTRSAYYGLSSVIALKLLGVIMSLFFSYVLMHVEISVLYNTLTYINLLGLILAVLIAFIGSKKALPIIIGIIMYLVYSTVYLYLANAHFEFLAQQNMVMLSIINFICVMAWMLGAIIMGIRGLKRQNKTEETFLQEKVQEG